MQNWLKFAEAIVRDAGTIACDAFRHPQILQLKENDDLVTQADRDVQAQLTGELAQRFPGHGIIAEEAGGDRVSNSPYTWILDPLTDQNTSLEASLCTRFPWHSVAAMKSS